MQSNVVAKVENKRKGKGGEVEWVNRAAFAQNLERKQKQRDVGKGIRKKRSNCGYELTNRRVLLALV